MSFALRLSLAANLVLAGVIAVLALREPSAAGGPALPAGTSQLRSPAGDPLPQAAVVPEPSARSTPSRLSPAVVSELEQMGISRPVLVSALLERFNRQWDARFTELQKRHAPKQVPAREYIDLNRLREADQVRELKETLGEDGYRAWDKDRTLAAVNSAGVPLTESEAEQAYRLQKDFEEKHRELQMAMEDGVADRADAATLQAQAQDALDRQLEELFGKQRLDAMRGFTDPVAEVYRTYGDLNPSPTQATAAANAETEHRAREEALAKRLKANPTDTAAITAELAALSEQRDETLRRIFGAAAYERLKQENDPTYKTLTQYAETWGLQSHEVQSVYSSVRAFQVEAERRLMAAQLRESAGQAVDWQEVRTSIDQERQQTEAGLQTLIGTDRLRRLKQNELLTRR